MFKLLNRSLLKNISRNVKGNQLNFTSDQSRYKILLANTRDSNDDKLESVKNLVNTIENEHQLMDPMVLQDATRTFLDIEANNEFNTNDEIMNHCSLGLALLGYCRPLKTDYLRVLSVDGGGIRGIAVIEMMKKLEELTGKRLFELFDFICGVSTGSIFICGMAAKDRSLMEGKMLYKDVAYKVFNRTSTMDFLSGASRMMWSHAYYDVELWEKLLREYITDTRIIDTAKFRRLPKFCCVSTTITDQIDAHVFRNYIHPYNVKSIYPGSYQAPLWKVVRCSSAAPTFFGDYILNNQVHQDGGILYNNPCHVAIHEAKLLWPNEKICLVSMGTGRSLEKRKIDSQKLYSAKQLSKIFGSESSVEEPETQTTSWKIKFMRILDAATDTEHSHHILSDLMSPGTYYRLNPYLTEMVSMTEYRVDKLRQLEKDAHMYFRRNEDKFEELAEKLVKPRNSIRAIKDVVMKNILY